MPSNFLDRFLVRLKSHTVQDLTLLLILGTFAVYALHASLVRQAPATYGDLALTPVFAGFGYVLSQPNLLYFAFVQSAYSAAGNSYGWLVNGVELFSFALIPISGYVLLAQVKLARSARLLAAFTYYFNPMTLHLSPLFPEWSEFLVLAPLAAACFIRFSTLGHTRHLLLGAWLCGAIVWVEPLGPETLRWLIPAMSPFIALAWLRTPRPSLWARVRPFIAGLCVFAVMVLPFVLVLDRSYSQLNALGQSTSGAFYTFHIGNVLFTYQRQTLLNSIAGLDPYPASSLYVLGYASSWSFTAWILLIVSGLFFALIWKPTAGGIGALCCGVVLGLAGFEYGVYTGFLIPLFREVPALFLYEYPNNINMMYPLLLLVPIGTAFSEAWGLAGRYLPRAARLLSLRVANPLAHSISKDHPALFEGDIGVKHSRSVTGFVTAVFAVGSIALLLAINYPLIHSSVSNSPPLRVGPEDYIPAEFSKAGTLIHSEVGLSRVLVLPMNYTTYLWALAQFPPSEIFGIPYAGVNSQSGMYVTLGEERVLVDALRVGSVSSVSQTLGSLNVRFVIVLNTRSSAPIVSTSTGYSLYLNGGGGMFLSKLEEDPAMRMVASESNTVVLSNQNYAGPALVEPSIAAYGVSPAPPQSSTGPYNLSSNSEFSEFGSNWSVYTGCPGGSSSASRFFDGSAEINVCGGVSGSRTFTLLYQRVAVLPNEELLIHASGGLALRCQDRLILIYHNLTNQNQFFSGEQSFPLVSIAPGVPLSYRLESPPDAVSMTFGVEISNTTSSNGSQTIYQLLISALGQVVTTLPPVSSSSFEYLFGQSLYIPSANVTPQAIPYVTTLTRLNPYALGIDSLNHNWSVSPGSGSIYLRNDSIDASLPCSQGDPVWAIGEVQIDEGITTIIWGSNWLNASSSQLFDLETTCGDFNRNQVSLSVDTSGLGSLLNLTVAVDGPNVTRVVSGSVVKLSGARESIVSGAQGILALQTPERAAISVHAGCTLIESSSVDSGYADIFACDSGSSFTITFTSHLLSTYAELANIATTVIFVLALAFILRPRLWRFGPKPSPSRAD